MGRPAVVGAERAGDRPQGQGDPRRRHEVTRGRPDRDRRHEGLRDARGRAAGASPRSTSTSSACSSGPTRSAASACARTPTRREDARRARELGAEGIGLCRTEHMFMAEDRQPKMRAMIMADDEEARRERARRAAAAPAGGLRGPVRGDEGPAGDDPAARPAAARVPAEPAGAARATSSARGSSAPTTSTQLEKTLAPRGGDPRGEPDARHARRAGSGSSCPEIYEMQVEAIMRAAKAVGRGAAPGDHDPAGRLRARARDDARAGRARRLPSTA